jgi:hypothetical protein
VHACIGVQSSVGGWVGGCTERERVFEVLDDEGLMMYFVHVYRC